MKPAAVVTRLEQALEGATSHGPVSEAAIASAETKLAVRFPTSYRAFLQRFGASFGKGLELWGLPTSDWETPEQMPQWSDVVAETLRSRRNIYAPLIDTFLPISHDGNDCEYLLDLGVMDADGECPVVALGPGREFDKVAASFLEFVERSCHGEVP